MRRIILFSVVATLSLTSLAGLRAAEPFYERRLEAGILAYARNDYVAAAEDLRVACFGLLGEPERLATCRTYLALTQAGRGDRTAFTETAQGILTLEQRLQAYSRADLTQEIRRLFEEQLRLWVPGKGDLRTVPASVDTVGVEPPGSLEPPESSESAEPPGSPESLVPPEPPESAEAAAVERQIEDVRTLLAVSRDRSQLEEAFSSLAVVANRHPEHRELQLLVAEIGYRLRRWRDTVHYFQRGAISEVERPERQFYYAVALYETGDREAAARVLELCLPKLQKTEFVNQIAAEVLGRSGG